MPPLTDPDELREIHHYGFAHRQLPLLFRAEPAASIATMGLIDPVWLRELWFEGAPAGLEGAPDGLACEALALPGSTLSLALFTLPKPWFTTGAHFAAPAVLGRFGAGLCDDYRFWTLERTRDEEPQTEAVLGAWEDGCHHNLGRIGPVSREAFLAAIVTRMLPGADPADLTLLLRVAL